MLAAPGDGRKAQIDDHGRPNQSSRTATVSAGRSNGGKWPHSLNTYNRAPGIAAAISALKSGGVNWSRAPTATSVGQLIAGRIRPAVRA